MATGGAWAAGATAGGVVGVRGEVGAAGVGVGVAGLRPLLYMGALCLNCAGRAGLGVLGSSGGRLASREGAAVSTVRPVEAPGGWGPSPRLCARPAWSDRPAHTAWLVQLSALRPGFSRLRPAGASGPQRGRSHEQHRQPRGGHRLQRALPWSQVPVPVIGEEAGGSLESSWPADPKAVSGRPVPGTMFPAGNAEPDQAKPQGRAASLSSWTSWDWEGTTALRCCHLGHVPLELQLGQLPVAPGRAGHIPASTAGGGPGRRVLWGPTWRRLGAGDVG